MVVPNWEWRELQEYISVLRTAKCRVAKAFENPGRKDNLTAGNCLTRDRQMDAEGFDHEAWNWRKRIRRVNGDYERWPFWGNIRPRASRTYSVGYSCGRAV